MNKKLLIFGLIIILAVLTAYTYIAFTAEETMVVEIFENGTQISVPVDTELSSHDNFSTIYKSNKTNILGFNTADATGKLTYSLMVSLIQESSNMENGYYKIDKDSARIIADKLGTGYSESNLKEGYVKIINNESLSQSIIIIGNDKAEIEKIVNSIVWKEVSGNLSVNTTTVEEPVYEDTTSETNNVDDANDKKTFDNADGIGLSDAEYSKQHQKEIDAYEKGLEDAGYFDEVEEPASDDASASSANK